MNTAVVQQIQPVEDDQYQLLFQNVVSVFGMVLVGINIREPEIKTRDIRVGDTVVLEKRPGGVGVSHVKAEERAPTSTAFFPPEPAPKPAYLFVSIGPFDAKKAEVDLTKTIPLTVKGIMGNAGIPNFGITNVVMGEGDAIEDLAAKVSAMATEPA